MAVSNITFLPMKGECPLAGLTFFKGKYGEPCLGLGGLVIHFRDLFEKPPVFARPPVAHGGRQLPRQLWALGPEKVSARERPKISWLPAVRVR